MKTLPQIFDILSYSKAASGIFPLSLYWLKTNNDHIVLRMLAEYVGEEKFLKGVSIYLKAHLYSNTVTEDLWKGIQSATNLDIPRVMDNWVKKVCESNVVIITHPHNFRAYRWDSQLYESRKSKVVFSSARIASSRPDQPIPKTTRRSGECRCLAQSDTTLTSPCHQVDPFESADNRRGWKGCC